VSRNHPHGLFLVTCLSAAALAGCTQTPRPCPDETTDSSTNDLASPQPDTQTDCPPDSNVLARIDAGTAGFAFGQGAVIDASRQTLYLMSLAGGVEAIDLASGSRLWNSPHAARPLLNMADLLFAQVEVSDTLTIALLDGADSGAVVFSAAGDFPEGVRAAVVDGMSTIFRVEPHIQAHDFYAAWTFTEQHAGGIDPGTDSNGLANSVTGALHIDLETGDVHTISLTEVPQPADPPLPENVADLVASGEIAGPIWRVDELLATLVQSPVNGGHETVLRRWRADTGDSLPATVLFDDEWTYRGVSADERHVLASRQADAAQDLWHWEIFSLATGERVGQLNLPKPGALFVVTGALVIYESPAGQQMQNGAVVDVPVTIHAADLSSGEQRWEFPRRDTAYRGPFPP